MSIPCPYPTTCEHSDYKKTGVPFCHSPVCPYKFQAVKVLQNQIARLESYKHRVPKQDRRLEKLRGQLALMMGSGTTKKACIDTGRNYVGFEIDDQHYRTACNRS